MYLLYYSMLCFIIVYCIVTGAEEGGDEHEARLPDDGAAPRRRHQVRGGIILY